MCPIAWFGGEFRRNKIMELGRENWVLLPHLPLRGGARGNTLELPLHLPHGQSSPHFPSLTQACKSYNYTPQFSSQKSESSLSLPFPSLTHPHISGNPKSLLPNTFPLLTISVTPLSLTFTVTCLNTTMIFKLVSSLLQFVL